MLAGTAGTNAAAAEREVVIEDGLACSVLDKSVQDPISILSVSRSGMP